MNPAWQSLNLVGGVAPIECIERSGDTVRVNDARTVFTVSQPDAFGAARSEDGLRALLTGHMPARGRVDDPVGFAEGVLAYDMELAAGARDSVAIAVPLHVAAPEPAVGAWPPGSHRVGGRALGRNHCSLAHTTRSRTDRAATLRRAVLGQPAGIVAWILVNREGPRIQPGPRCYRRSWIRDGTLTGTALTEMGFADEARAFLRWYAPYQLDEGACPAPSTVMESTRSPNMTATASSSGASWKSFV